MYRGYCTCDRRVLFDVPGFEAFKKKPPNLAVKIDPRIFLTCRHCGLVWMIVHKGEEILYRLKGQPATENIEAEKYG